MNNSNNTTEVKTLTVEDLQKIKGALSTETELISIKGEDSCGNKQEVGDLL